MGAAVEPVHLSAEQTTSFERVRYDFVPATDFGTPAWYTVTAADEESGFILGRRLVPANIDGTPPKLSSAQLMNLVGGRYRLECARVDHALDRLAKLNAGIARQVRLDASASPGKRRG